MHAVIGLRMFMWKRVAHGGVDHVGVTTLEDSNIVSNFCHNLGWNYRGIGLNHYIVMAPFTLGKSGRQVLLQRLKFRT